MTLFRKGREWLLLLLLTAAAIPLHGYHLGVDDQVVYLPAIKQNLDAHLYPYDATFFLSQTQFMMFDKMVAASVRFTGLPLDAVIFIWYLLAIFLQLLACWKISRKCFAEPIAQWGAVLAVWLLLPLPIAGTGTYMLENYLHPRGLAEAAVLFAVAGVLARRWTALLWLALAALFHPSMAVFGAGHLLVQALPKMPPMPWSKMRAAFAAALPMAVPLGIDTAWRRVVASRYFIFPLRWTWYQWLGTYGAIALLVLFAWIARRNGQHTLAKLCSRIAISGGVGVYLAVWISVLPFTERWIPLESMRVLCLVYTLMFLCAGGLLAQYVLRNRPLRWAMLVIPLGATMFVVQRADYLGSPNVEWPGQLPQNHWVTAFDWVRQHTPANALVAHDPQLMLRAGSDMHGLRAFAERSMLADYVKDRAVASNFPELAPEWSQEVDAREDWRHFTRKDFHELHKGYGVDWVVLEMPPPEGLHCQFENEVAAVCKID
ncbi:MAG: hypothetical protein HY046_12180 [Acidobacteria bacterium]|nr:hypothetical protein [Acidobacteriota bacterium]